MGKRPGLLGVIFRKAQSIIQDPAKLRRLIVDLIDKEQWSSLSADVKGDAYEGLPQKNAEDVKGGAGQYFTPRPLIAAIVEAVSPQPGQTICDPACGTGGFLLAAHDHIAGIPGLDKALSALILDLEARGMFDDTLILCLTEHGRTPKLSNTARGAGREHWSRVYSNLVAGGGFSRGCVVGSSDRNGAHVDEHPVSPKDILCTMYHLMGIDPHLTIPDRLGRPLPLVAEGSVLPALLG